MSRIAYVNGDYVAHGRAAVHIEDRGYQFADGVYEVIAVRHGAVLGGDGHRRRPASAPARARGSPSSTGAGGSCAASMTTCAPIWPAK